MRALGAVVLLAAITGVTAVSAQEVLIRNARVYTVSDGVREGTDVLLRDGKVVALGEKLKASAAAAVVDARGQPLTPGIFGGLSQIGVVEIGAEPSTVDGNLTFKGPGAEQQWRPEFDITLAFDAQSTLVPVARIEGITWTVLTPVEGSTIMAGQGAAVTLDGRQDAVFPDTRALFVQMGIDGKGLAGGSRAGLYMLLDQAISEAHSKAPFAENSLLHPAGREVLSRYLSGGRVVFNVERASDILGAIAFARKQGMKPIVFGGSEAWRVAKELAAARVPVVLNPLRDLPYEFEQLGSRLDNAALLQRAGVLIAFSADDGHDARNIRQLAGNAVAHGLSWDAALAAITRNPAEIFGLGATHGRVAIGQSADLVLWDGDPLEVSTIATQVWISGRAIPMRSRQSELRDRYLKAAAR
jgi:Amidohydrolase family